ncbi:uncharacterized protein LOC129228518 [Uloborus diversus]|uniref:uncharacterized protein LOC129228518 n=1 Tax=Uloborus diversus TaxID=327109 RepID=UPI0024096E4F|nr:uncharacterized protein LOC129228518 [Uloborus diversus]
MSDPEKLEKVKKEIRSLLISYQKGCSLYEFKKTFEEFMGKKLPSAEFGFQSDVDFLRTLRDVVDIQMSGRDYYLYGIADEKSQHIQKLVCKQKSARKPPKLTRSYPARPVRAQNLPPRFSKKVPQVSYNARKISENSDNQWHPFEYTASQRRATEYTDSKRHVAEYTDSQRHASENADSQRRAAEHTDGQRHASEYADGILPKKELINLVHAASWDGISLTNLLTKYQQTYKKPFSFKQFGFSSLRTCIESIPELTLVTGQNDVVIYDSSVAVKILKNESKKLQQETSSSVKYDAQYFNDDDRWTLPVSHAFSQKEKESTYSANAFHIGANVKQDENKYNEWIHTVSETSFQFGKGNEHSSKHFHSGLNMRQEKDDFSASEQKHSTPVQIPAPVSSNKMDAIEPIVTRIIPENIKVKLRKVAVENRQGILAKDFLSRYEEVTNTTLDLHSLGYSTLMQLIEDVADIFMCQLVFGSKKDWIIYPTDSNPKGLSLDSTHNQVLTVELIKRNIKGILEAYPEGVKLHEFLHLYSLNCNDPLCLKELGFDNLEQFLIGIANSVPLKIEASEGCQMVYLLEEPIRGPTPDYNVFSREAMPPDVVSYDATYAVQELPKDLDLSKFFPIYTSSISNPNLMYIQLPTDTDDLNILGDELDIFYKSSQSDRYMMKNAHIKVGAVCASLWPVDQLWYRAQILSISSLEFVKVFYVDYGTTCEVPTTKLRYLKREFFHLPAQALRAQLACVKPKHGTGWTKNVLGRLLDLCRDKRLMAKIQDITDNGILSLVICDTTGDEDVFINDVLVKEGIAEMGELGEEDNALQNSASFPVKPNSPVPNDLANALALQAQFFQAWATAAATSPNQNYGNLVKQMSLLNLQQASTSPSQQGLPLGMGVNPFLGAVTPSIPNATVGNPFLSAIAPNLPNPLIGTASTYDFAKFPASGSTVDSAQSRHMNKPSSELMDAIDEFENDMFDDDDELFQQFCSKVEVKSFPNKRFVKRVDLGDGYRIHLIIYDAKPYSSGGDISTIIWMNKDSDFMNRQLQVKETSFAEIIVSEEGNEELFRQMDLYKVKGVQKITGSKSSVLLYPFANIIKILNLYGHPSLNVRVKLIEENSQFRLADPIWQELPDEDKIEDISSSPLMAITDDDKIAQMCLTDLMAMKEGICCRRIRLMKRLSTQPANPSAVDEVEKMDQLLSKVLERIKVIKTICSSFS